ncbi:MAG: hypothetical protein MUF04_03005 [Akkermansiaceae bacterium]|jgi:hypothetical protein|nr:hypothetical protein [Akkermansiaceae bacterium]
MTIHRAIFFTAALGAALAVSCCSPPPPPATEDPQDVAPEFTPVAGDATADDIARFLAGKPVRAGAMLSRLQQSQAYAGHEAEMRGVWVTITRNRVQRMEMWSAEQVRPATYRDRVLFYPFGGPDLLHAEAMFPHLPNKILMGLEPVGSLPALESLTEQEVLAALPAYRQATRKQMQVSFFVTKDMKTELRASVLDGVTPILLATVALLDGTVEAVHPLRAGSYPAVDIRYRNREGRHCSVVYVQGDLSNSGFGKYREFLDSYGRGSAYVKAASYLMHESSFSAVRGYLLANCNSILQDDSGIPYRFFAPDQWHIRLFGVYDAPIPLFAEYTQQDLRTAFALAPPAPMGFGSGYHFRARDTNLLFATRGTNPAPPRALPVD